MNKNQRGFATIGIIVIVVVVLAVVSFFIARSMKKENINEGTADTSNSSDSSSNDRNSSKLGSNQRDTERKNNLTKFLSGVSAYAADNKGNLPESGNIFGNFIEQYLSPEMGWHDPSSNKLLVVVAYTPKELGKIYYSPGHMCAADAQTTGKLSKTDSSRAFAALLLLENGTYYCAEG